MTIAENSFLSASRPESAVTPGYARDNWRLFDSLLRLGHFYQLDFSLCHMTILAELKQFDSSWVQYNPYKPQIPRRGLSITSLDGGMSGEPDLYSLKEYHRREGVLYKESDFRTYTDVYRKMPSIHRLIDHFHPYVGRTHFLRFDAGGYFPPHRDGAFMDELDTFRILVPLVDSSTTNFVFMHGTQPLRMESGIAYFLNTMMAHSIFSFADDVPFLVCNIILNEETVQRLKVKLWDK